jgi:chromate transporter
MGQPEDAARPRGPSSGTATHGSLLTTFSKIGLFTFGGGYAMIPLIEREIVDRRHWLSERDLVDQIALAQSLPGVFAVNLAALIGQRLRGRSGAIFSALGCALPSFLVILLIAMFLERYRELPAIQNAFVGVRAAVTAQILLATVKMGRQIIRDRVTAGIALAALLLILFLNLHPIFIVLGGLLMGLAMYWLSPSYTRKISGSGKGEESDL